VKSAERERGREGEGGGGRGRERGEGGGGRDRDSERERRGGRTVHARESASYCSAIAVKSVQRVYAILPH
jgi:hypothetical protein